MDRQEKINKVQELLSSGLLSENAKKALIEDFPELRESEDERIRKRLIEEMRHFQREAAKESCDADFEFAKSAIAYLEKQKEQKGSLRVIKDASEWEKIKEQKPAECITDEEMKRSMDSVQDFKVFAADLAKTFNITHERDIDWHNFCAGLLTYLEQNKPAEWSEEDLQHESWILECLADGKRTMPQYAADFHAAYNWLKSIRPSWKPSNLELGALRTAISVLTEERNFQRAGKHLQDILDHFEGKETRHDWKPSELQMFALDSAILMFHNLKRGGDKKELESLYNDLKKL